MKNTPQIVRHGEVLLKPTTLPQDAVLKETVKSSIVAHSETGHHHVLEATKPFEIYTWNGETFINLFEEGRLIHRKTGKDIHKTHKIVPAVYKVVIKKEFNYFEGLMQRVRD